MVEGKPGEVSAIERHKVNQNRHLICTVSASEHGIIGVPNKVKELI